MNISKNSDFSIHNLPFGVFSQGGKKRVGIAIGEHLVDLKCCFDLGLFKDIHPADVYEREFLNAFISLGKSTTDAVRLKIQRELLNEGSPLKEHEAAIIDRNKVSMHLPLQIFNYTDFYSSRYHAENVGRLFRDPEHALPPNWLHMPIAYHGRASSIVVSGSTVYRPKGQIYKGNELIYDFSEQLDFELEMAAVIGKNSRIGDAVSIDDADEYIFGYALFNDWSARDLQRWEYQPLGPFTGKNFCSTISPWVITRTALEVSKVGAQKQDPVLEYLQDPDGYSYDIKLQALVNGTLVTDTNYKHLYWTTRQQIAHHTVGGCNLCIGDVLASGTISGPETKGSGCLLELTKGGKESVSLNGGEQRCYLQEGDDVLLKAAAQYGDYKIGFGENSGKIRKYDS